MRGKEFSLERECIPLLQFFFFCSRLNKFEMKDTYSGKCYCFPKLPLSEYLKLNCYVHYKGRVSVKIIRFSDICLYFVKEYFRFKSHFILVEVF